MSEFVDKIRYNFKQSALHFAIFLVRLLTGAFVGQVAATQSFNIRNQNNIDIHVNSSLYFDDRTWSAIILKVASLVLYVYAILSHFYRCL